MNVIPAIIVPVVSSDDESMYAFFRNRDRRERKGFKGRECN